MKLSFNLYCSYAKNNVIPWLLLNNCYPLYISIPKLVEKRFLASLIIQKIAVIDLMLLELSVRYIQKYFTTYQFHDLRQANT